MEYKAYVWVPKESYDKVSIIGIQLNRTKEEVVDFAKSRYLNRWLAYFQDAKTKKEIWRRLTDSGKRYPSLSTFYAHIKYGGSETYLRREFNYNNVPAILTKLGVIDNEVDERLKATKEIEDELRKMKEQLIREGYK